jgi:crotonobetainyl-CoA:carnitine CoA-transferase CaiB-like acyl-CoA transferase
MAAAPAYAPVIHAASGYEVAYNQYQRGSDRPANNGIFIADVMGASYAFGAIQLALYEREKSGRGQHIDVSLMDSVLGMLIYEMQAAQFPPDRPRQVYEPVRSSDGYVMVAAVTQRNLEVLFETDRLSEGKTDPALRDDGDEGGELAGAARTDRALDQHPHRRRMRGGVHARRRAVLALPQRLPRRWPTRSAPNAACSSRWARAMPPSRSRTCRT